ncbi:MAG: rhomboid family intramembrane serine protease [Alkalilacustris sp.]
MSDWLPPMTTRPNTPAILGVVCLLALPELLFLLDGTGLFGREGLRTWAVVHFGFWNQLLMGGAPVWAFQREAMFLTYALLHGGFVHLAGNVVVTLALAGIVVARSSDRGFLALFALSAIGGGVGYALLGPAGAPMVGASGAVFGLIGAWKYWEWEDRRSVGASMRPLWMSVIGLALLNLVIFVMLDGLLAWEAHLGGAVAGALWAAIVAPAQRRR